MGVAWDSRESSAVPVYRLYHAGTRDHHYTKDYNEYQVLAGRGWKQEGVAWYSDDVEGVPVYRLYHEGTLNHHYTKDYNEYQVLAGRGWKQEGVAWYGVAEDTLHQGLQRVPGARRPWLEAGGRGLVWRGGGHRSREPYAHHGRVAGLRGADGRLLSQECWRVHVPGQRVHELWRADPAGFLYDRAGGGKGYGAPTLQDFCTIVLEEAKAEGVRAEVVFAQAMKETGWLRFVWAP